MAEAQSALTNQAASSDQRLQTLAQESQSHLDLLQRDAEEQRVNLREQMTTMHQEIFTLKGNLQQAMSENNALSGRLLVGQEAVAETKKQLDEERARSALLMQELQGECQKTVQMDFLAEELRGERQKTAQLESQVCSMNTRFDSQTAEMQALRHRLILLGVQGSGALPERVSKLLAEKNKEVQEGQQSVAALLQRQAESQRYISDLRNEHAEVQMRAKEWQDKYNDLENVRYHSGHNSSGTAARLSEGTRDSGAGTLPLVQVYHRPASSASQVEPPSVLLAKV